MSDHTITKDTSQDTIIQIASKCDVSTDCKSCQECCKRNSGLVLDTDIPKMAEHLGIDEQEVKDKYLDEVELFGNVIHKLKLKTYPVGECILLTKDGCGIHEHKPLHCRAGTWDSKTSAACYDWFVLNKLIDNKKPESIRQWHQHLRFRDHPPICGGTVEELVPDKEERQKILKRQR